VTRRIVFSPEAQADLLALYDHVAEQAGEARALAYLEQIEVHCRGFVTFPHRGTRRDDLRHGLRTVGFKRQLTIAFHVEADRVVFDRILYRGRDVARAFH